MEGSEREEEHPLARTEATKLVAAALERVQRESGKTQREIAHALGYKSSVVLSHIALGRVPIPVDRASEIARLLGIDEARLVLAVLKQRFPHIDFDAVFGARVEPASEITAQLEDLAGVPLDDLPLETQEVLREAVHSPRPSRRWLALPELTVMEVIRSRFPHLRERGLTTPQREKLLACLDGPVSDAQ